MDSAVILAEGVFGSTYGKTAHGLVRFTSRYKIEAVIDSQFAGKDAGEILTGERNGIPIVSTLHEAINYKPKFLIIGAATDGGYLPENYRKVVREAIENGIGIVSGLHEFISDDPEFSKLANEKGVTIIDVRKMFRDRKIPFTGRIEEVKSKKIAVLGTDSAIGKRTTAVTLWRELNKRGKKAEMIGTGQTAWMQGFKYCAVIDACINDFVAGNIEHEVVKAWFEEKPEYIILEGQGSIVHPAYPGSFEIIAAGRPDGIILQHAPGRKTLDGFPNYPMPDVRRVIKILELLSQKKVIAITFNTENLTIYQAKEIAKDYGKKFRIPVILPLQEPEKLAEVVESYEFASNR